MTTTEDTNKPTFDLTQAQQACFLKPMAGKCIVLSDEFQYTGKLVIPDTAKRRPTTGRVLDVGDADFEFLIGKRVLYGFYNGTPIKFSGKPTYMILGYDEIMACLREEEESLSLEQQETSL